MKMSKLVFGNQKMYMNRESVIDFINNLKTLNNLENVVVFPSYLYLTDYSGVVNFGSQDVSNNENGAYTGEVSASQIKSTGAKYSLVGHSERRSYHKEDNNDFLLKINNLIKEDLIPVFCIGENETEYDNKETKKVLFDQITSVYNNLSINDIPKIIIAYEPVWAIGTGKTPNNEEISEVVSYIKELVNDRYNTSNIKVLYGGSVNNKNVDSLNEMDIVDGYLIGGSSSKIDEFKYIIERCL